ncbi:uncharacterized protein MELLADRAFT_123564 [Melampsora larici-populina 98AG31]|uniref:Secreted protein n=1 Tax=Melampsora larici-populina (strain 98AG31 / pathotype 3-4-7) TaxID=747676 RepID=F4RRZ6_MELLP|nr:uncharacterized protein MELLADRAFT_123564 [Melampsora larici-populina 98AG31]EGG04866.1 secreted protein [Melampsora larici-populina 98AG31]
MLHAFLKISLLLFSLLITDVIGDSLSNVLPCSIKFEVKGDKAVCTGSGIVYDCPLKACWWQNHQYVHMTGCQLEKGPPGISGQDCAQYEWIHPDPNVPYYFKCTNPAGYHYKCPFDGNIAKSMGCTATACKTR